MSSIITIGGGNEKAVSFTVSVEKLRLWALLSFDAIIATGIVLTKGFASFDQNDNFLTRVFGNTNVCIYFDFPPSTYVLPALYNVTVVLAVAFALASSYRARIAHAENKISSLALKLLNVAYGYFAFSAAVFTTIFATSPDETLPATMIIHSAPFVNLEVALLVIQVATTWYGQRVVWRSRGMPSWETAAWWVHVLLLALVTALKISCQVNALGDMDGANGKGMWWSVRDPSARVVSEVLDISWLLLANVIPTAQAAYIVCSRYDEALCGSTTLRFRGSTTLRFRALGRRSRGLRGVNAAR